MLNVKLKAINTNIQVFHLT